MAKLELEISKEEKAVLEHEANIHGLPVTDYARQRLFGQATNGKANDTNGKTAVFTSEDGEEFEFFDESENLSRSCAFASENVLRQIWDTPEEEEGCRRLIAETSS